MEKFNNLNEEKEYLQKWRLKAINKMLTIENIVNKIVNNSEYLKIDFIEIFKKVTLIRLKLLKPNQDIINLWLLKKEFTEFIEYINSLNQKLMQQNISY